MILERVESVPEKRPHDPETKHAVNVSKEMHYWVHSEAKARNMSGGRFLDMLLRELISFERLAAKTLVNQ